MSTLNTKQLEAVQHQYGPMRVLAGPGTGKTEVLGQRIAALINSDIQVNPSEILCITFTDAGRIAMRTRLTKICGTEIAQKVAIHTFHSFCNAVIKENYTYFDNDDLEPITELEEVLYLKRVIDKLPSDHILRDAKKPYKSVKLLKELFQLIKKENLKQDELIAGINFYLENVFINLYNYKNSAKKGQKKLEFYEKQLGYKKTIEAIRLFDVYQDLLTSKGRYDFFDMILWVIRAFEENQDILFDNAERYQYILVDEYQDTNGSQNRLLELLCDANPNGNPNLFVVGDDDQSIYGFQGASRQNMTQLKEKYQAGMNEVTLDINYRSTQEILDFAEQFVSKNGLDRIKKDFNGLTAHKGKGIEPQLIVYQNTRHEMVDIANQIEAKITQGIKPNEIAVLFTRHEECLKLGRYLNKIGIDFYARKNEKLFDQPLVKKLIQVLSYINLELSQPYSGDLLLFEILHYDFFKIAPNDIALVSIKAAEHDSKRSIRFYLNDWLKRANPNQFKDQPDSVILNIMNTLEHLIKLATNESIYILFKEVIRLLDIHSFVVSQSEKIELIDQLTALFEFIDSELSRDAELDLPNFIELLKILKENNIDVDHIKIFGNRNSVQILTLHGSKGLEFDCVFIPNIITNRWEKKRKHGTSYKLPPISRENIDGIEEEKVNDEINPELEKRRLLYVAMTRAKAELHISFATHNEKNKEQEGSTYLFEIFKDAAQDLNVYQKNISMQELLRFEPVDVVEKSSGNIKLLEREYIDKALEKFAMNATALNNFIKCPLDFYFNNILKVPFGISENASFGSSIHNALEMLFKDMKDNNANDFASADFLIDAFKKEMFARRRNFTNDGYKNFTEYGQRILTEFYNHNVTTWNKIVSIEWKPKVNPTYKGIPLTGFMDKLEFNGNHVNIVDYKTGDVDGDYAKKNLINPVKANRKITGIGGGYWRQAVFYKIIMDNDKSHQWDIDSAEFIFVEPSKLENIFKSEKYFITQEEVELVQKQIADSYTKIMNHEFSKGCGKDDCKWCTLAKDNDMLLPEPLSSVE